MTPLATRRTSRSRARISRLIQQKNGAFPTIKLKKDPTLTSSEPGATLKTYDDDWYGSLVTVFERIEDDVVLTDHVTCKVPSIFDMDAGASLNDAVAEQVSLILLMNLTISL